MGVEKRKTLSNAEYFAEGTYKKKLKQEFTIAGVVNIAVKTILAPLERWRIIAQTQTAYPLRPKKFTSFFNFISRAPKQQGLMSLWRGNMAHCWMYFYQTLFQVAVYDSFKSPSTNFFEDQDQMAFLTGLYNNLLFPLFASSFSLALIYPLDTYRIHLAMSYHGATEKPMFRKFRERLKQAPSFKKMYSGYWAGCASSLILFNYYRHMGSALGQLEIQGLPKQFSDPQVVLSIMGVGLVHPLDTMRKMLQLNNMFKPQIFSGYRSLLWWMRENKLSIMVLYRGLAAALARTTLFMPLYWGMHREWQGYLNRSSQE